MKNQKMRILVIVCIVIGILAGVVGMISILRVQNATKNILSESRKAASSASVSKAEVTNTPTPAVTAKPTAVPTATPTVQATPTADPALIAATAPTQEATPVPTETPQPMTSTGNGHIIAVDAGHQGQGNSEQEPIGPGASETKAKVASGTSGRTTGVPEYQLNLDVSLKLRDELQNRGYQVVMIRETNDVNISNAERAEIANNSGAEIFLRIHANGSDDTDISGALTMAPSSSNPYVGGMASSCQHLSECVVNSYCAATGFPNLGVQNPDNMSGINWCRIPVTIVEMGFMTNANDDTSMQDQAMQYRMAAGIADGVDAYFAS